MQAALKAWLNGAQSYAVGVTLYKKYGNNEAYQKLLVLPETPFRKEQLILAMQEAVAPPAPVQEIAPVDNQDDEVVKALKQKAIPILKERNDLHAKLRLFRTVAERGRAAHRILDLDDEVDEIYDALRYYQANKVLPEEKLPFTPITDPTKWEHRYQTCGRYVRRYLAALEKNPENKKAKELKEQYEAEQLWLAKKLNKWHC
jgi:uncharacterized protein YrzB (UPF0473 family)